MGSYLKVEMLRGLRSYKFLFSILMVIGILFIGTLEGISTDVSVYYTFRIVMIGGAIIVMLAAGAFSYADSLHEDLEKKYMMQQVLRKNLKLYCISKTISIFILSMLTVALGIFFFTLILRSGVPWITEFELEPGGRYELDVIGTRFTWALESKNFPLFYLLYGLQYGVLAGNLAIISSLIGLFLPNRMLIYASPMILYYMVEVFLHESELRIMGVASIFDGFIDYFEHDVMSVGITIFISLIIIILVATGIYHKLRRDEG